MNSTAKYLKLKNEAEIQLEEKRAELKAMRKEFQKVHGTGFWGNKKIHRELERLNLLIRECDAFLEKQDHNEFLKSSDGCRQFYKNYETLAEGDSQ